MAGITDFYYGYLTYLKEKDIKRKLALLQLTGRIEDYLTKEFSYYIATITNGKNFVINNAGNKYRRIDMLILAGDIDKPTICGLIEVKYLRNIQRFWEITALDEHSTVLDSLKNQIGTFKEKSFYGLDVSLLLKDNQIYGLIFASYVSQNSDEDEVNKFFNNIKNKDEAKYLRYYDKKTFCV